MSRPTKKRKLNTTASQDEIKERLSSAVKPRRSSAADAAIPIHANPGSNNLGRKKRRRGSESNEDTNRIRQQLYAVASEESEDYLMEDSVDEAEAHQSFCSIYVIYK